MALLSTGIVAPSLSDAISLSGTQAPAAERLRRLQDLHPKVIDLSLGRIERLLGALGHPERSLPPVIHVAGTNGKGSVVAFARAILEAAGHRVHIYTSPHLVRFNERIRLAGQIIDDDELCRTLDDCERANDGEPITFFEVTTAAALLAFSRHPADFVVLETGLGGRLDATNVVDRPAVTAITTIGYDHQNFLGDSLKGIAQEKAGILKAAVPSAIAAQTGEVEDAITARAEEIGATLLWQDQDWTVRPEGDGMIYEDRDGTLILGRPGLAGPHQIQNTGVAIAALRAVPGLQFSGPVIDRAMSQVRWPARLQNLTDGPLRALLPPDAELWLDGGHNPSAGQALALALKEMTPARPLHLIIGMLNTKDARGFLAPLADLAAGVHAVPVAGEPAGMEPEALAAAARELGIQTQTDLSVEDALKAIAQTQGAGAPRVLICGSLYLAGQVLRDNGLDRIEA